MICKGFSLRRQAVRYLQYCRVIGDHRYCRVADLADAVGLKPAEAVKDLRRMLAAHFFQEGYFDEGEQCFILDYEAFQEYRRMQENLRRIELEEAQKKERLFKTRRRGH